MLRCLSQGLALRDHSQSSKIATAGGGLLTQGASLDARDSGSVIDQCNWNRLPPLLRFHDLHRNSLSLGKSAQPSTFNDGGVKEHILFAVLARDKPEPFVGVEPLYGAFEGNCGPTIMTIPVGRSLR
jgi:hypothetical protein